MLSNQKPSINFGKIVDDFIFSGSFKTKSNDFNDL